MAYNMSVHSKQLAIRQLDHTLSRLKQLASISRPGGGWLKAIRKTLGMSAKHLGNRAGMSQAGIAQIEKGEAEGRTTLSTMNKMAAALDCSFVYALVPNSTLKEFIERQARVVATREIRSTSHTMLLESQTVASEQTEAQIKMLADEILATLPRSMWNQDDT